MGFPDSSVGTESACNAGDPSLIPGLGRSPGEGIGHPHQYSRALLVARTVKNLPAMQETWVRSLGRSSGGGHAWQPTPVFLPGESPWTKDPGGPWGCKELDMTERLSLSLSKMLAPWKKTMANLDSILKSRDITLLTKVHLVKAVFSNSHVWI